MVGRPELVLRKARASYPTFLGAEACEAKVRTLLLVLIGGILPPGLVSQLALRKARASCPTFLGAEACEAEVRTLLLVFIGGILPPILVSQLALWKARASCPTFLGQKHAKPRIARFCFRLPAEKLG